MAGPALAALLLLLLLAGKAASTGTGGGLCPREDAHRCPQLRYGADAQLCCSTCRLFCCPAGKAQLQGRRGPREAPATPGPSSTQPSTPTNTPLPPPKEPSSFKGWAVVLAFAGLVAWIILWIVLRYWRTQRRHQRRAAWHAALLSFWNPRRPRLEELALSSVLGTPPPYAADPPPYSEVEPEERGSSPPQAGPSCLSSPGSSEEEVTIEPLGSQNLATGCLLESPLEEDPSAEQ